MSTDPLSLRADARRNYDHLLRTAENIFSAQGASATFESIAKQAGVGIGTLYRHFPTRKMLLEAVYADRIAILVGRASSLLLTNSPDKALVAWLQMTVKYITEYSGFDDLLSLTLEDGASPVVSAGSSLLVKTQKAGLLRKDVTIVDLLRLVNGIVASNATPGELKRIDGLISGIVAGLKPVTIPHPDNHRVA